MMINIGGYVFGYDEEKNDIICFKNRRVRYETEAPDIISREHFRRCCENLIPIIENVPDEYIESMLELDDLAEGFEI